MTDITNEPGRCVFNVQRDVKAVKLVGWNHDPDAMDCLCHELGLTGCDCEACHSLRRLNGLCVEDCELCVRSPRQAPG